MDKSKASLPSLRQLRAIIFDRDGTLNMSGPAENGGYILSPEQMMLMGGVKDALETLYYEGIQLFVFSQQNCVTKGLIDTDGVDAVHAQLNTLLVPAQISAFYYNTQDGAAPDWSKPAPGMLNAILHDYAEDGLNAHNTLVVGDAVRDAEAAAAAGLPFAFVASDQDEKIIAARKTNLPFFTDLPELVAFLAEKS